MGLGLLNWRVVRPGLETQNSWVYAPIAKVCSVGGIFLIFLSLFTISLLKDRALEWQCHDGALRLN